MRSMTFVCSVDFNCNQVSSDATISWFLSIFTIMTSAQRLGNVPASHHCIRPTTTVSRWSTSARISRTCCMVLNLNVRVFSNVARSCRVKAPNGHCYFVGCVPKSGSMRIWGYFYILFNTPGNDIISHSRRLTRQWGWVDHSSFFMDILECQYFFFVLLLL